METGFRKLRYKFIFHLAALIIPALMTGCAPSSKPHIRISPFFGSITGIPYSDPNNLKPYKYCQYSGDNGLLYTCRGGYIDLGHLNEAADRTKYVYELISDDIQKNKKEIIFEMIEPGIYQVYLNYPERWETLSDREKAESAKGYAINLAQYIAYNSTVWHEIITWYGWSTIIIFPEKISAFSFEDIYSDLIGCYLAGKALEENADFDSSMNRLIREELKNLEPRSRDFAKEVTSKIKKSRWFKGGGLVYPDLYKRSFATGKETGYISPFLIPEICPCEPAVYPVYKDIESTSVHGFSSKIELRLEGRVKNKIMAIVNKEAIDLDGDFIELIDQAKKEAIQEYGCDVDKPILNEPVK